MKIYLADLNKYNEGYLVGKWIDLPCENTYLDSIINKLTNNGQTDYAIHDYELPFNISEYTDPYKINSLCEHLYNSNTAINKYLINHIEYSNGIDILDIEPYEISNYIEDIYTIEAITDYEFAQNYMYEYYESCIDEMPWELSYSIDYNCVFNKLEMTLAITKDPEKDLYYYSNK